MNKQRMGTPDYRTYEDYIDLGKVNTKSYLMLSELIDNSISSFDTEYGEGKWKNKLKIRITIDNPKKKTSSFHGIQYYKNSYIEVIDNAFGIKKEKLADSLKLNKKNFENTSKMNVHGRGLKQSSFYFGLGVILTSKAKGSKESFYVDNLPMKEGIQNEVYYNENKAEQTFQGTSIKIVELRESHRFTPSKLAQVMEALSYRYAKLIELKKLEIKFEYKIESMKSFSTEFISGVIDDASMVNEDFNYSLVERKEVVKTFKEIIEKIKKSSDETKHFSLYPKLVNDTVKKLSDIVLTKDKKQKFKWNQEIIINKNEKVNMNFWLVSKKENASDENSKSKKRGYSNKRGIRIHEGDRSILHPPIIPNEISTYLDPLPAANRTGSVDNRFAGEVNISDFSASTTTDKSTFEFKTQEDKETFDKQISVVFDIFEQLILQGRSSNKDSAAAKFSNNDKNKLNATMVSKFKTDNIVKKMNFDEEDSDVIIGEIIFNKREYNIFIKINDKSSPKELISLDIDNDKSVVNAVMFNGHNLWKNINENKNFNVEALIPIFMLLVFQEMSFHAKVADKKELQEYLDEISPANTINEMSRGIK